MKARTVRADVPNESKWTIEPRLLPIRPKSTECSERVQVQELKAMDEEVKRSFVVNYYWN